MLNQKEYLIALEQKLKENHQIRSHFWQENGLPKYTNALILSQSPYLLQHAHNPVDWMEWGDEAFALAKHRDVPIFLSIGYSTCHWCHVMERESFEDEEISHFLNDHFVSIKVDREELPAIDSVYMDFVQLTTGHGGWPLSMFLSPDLRPIFGGTYFPARDGDRGVGRGFLSYLKLISKNFKDPQLLKQADEPLNVLKTSSTQLPLDSLDQKWLEEASEQWKRQFDENWGGFGSAPKFPRPAVLEALLRIWFKTGDAELLKMVEVTVERMYCGGIYDHIAGGFARYSVDNRWWVPHFEKMLYDNAQILNVLTELYQITKRSLYAQIAQDILLYLKREMKHPLNGFYAATDADSLDTQGNSHEGEFFVWQFNELKTLLSEEQFKWFTAVFGIKENGNFERNRNVLYLYEPLDDEEISYFKEIRQILYQARQQRPKPSLDDKIICAWNALLIDSMCKAGIVFANEDWIKLGQSCVDFILNALWDGKKLWRSWRNGRKTKHLATLEDYTALSYALITVFEATGKIEYLKHAKQIYACIEPLEDPEHGGFFRINPKDRQMLPFAEKPIIDSAEPSGNAYAALTAIKLYQLTDQIQYRSQAQRTLKYIASLMSKYPTATPKALCALTYYLDSKQQISVVQGKDLSFQHPLIRSNHFIFHPYTIKLHFKEITSEIKAEIPALAYKEDVDQSIAYVCSINGCSPSISDHQTLMALLKRL
jgi:uncharacterized protein YyaL (SSP411 family)